MDKRQSDSEPAGAYDRSPSRTYERDGQWFYASREGEFGPFASEAEAVEDLEAYVAIIDLKAENEGPVTPD